MLTQRPERVRADRRKKESWSSSRDAGSVDGKWMWGMNCGYGDWSRNSNLPHGKCGRFEFFHCSMCRLSINTGSEKKRCKWETSQAPQINCRDYMNINMVHLAVWTMQKSESVKLKQKNQTSLEPVKNDKLVFESCSERFLHLIH